MTSLSISGKSTFKSDLIFPILGIASLFSTMFYGRSGITSIIFFLFVILFFEFFFDFSLKGRHSPYFMMLVSPLLLIHYSCIADFNLRITIFLFLIYIFSISVFNPTRKIKIKNTGSKPILIWIIPFFIFSMLSLHLYFKGVYLSGDEPHYLMITQSIVDDGDFNLKNNIENKTYLNFIPVELRAHVIIKNGRHLSYHMPGMSFLLTPFYILYKQLPTSVPPQLFFRISASFINSFFAFVLFYVLRFLFPGKNIFSFWFFSLLIFPVLFHSVHLFPELPAATLLMGSFLFVFSKKEKPLLAGILFSLSIWFHVKYYPALFIFAVFVLIRYLREKDLKKITKFFLLPVLSSFMLILYCKFLYNTLSPTNIFPPENYLATPILLKLKVLLSYFFDQRDGLLIYTPVLFLFFFGFKKKFENKKILLTTMLIYLIFHSITTVRGAYSPAGRPIIFIFWIILIFTANYYFSSKSKIPLRSLTGLSLFVSFWLLSYPLLAYQPVFSSTTFRWSGLLRFLGSDIIDLPRFFPSFLTHTVSFYIPNLIWIGILSLCLLLYYGKITIKRNFDKKLLLFSVFLVLAYTFSFYPHLYLKKKGLYINNGIRFFNNSGNFIYLKGENSFRVKTGKNYDIYIDRNSKRKRFTLILESPGEIEISLMNGKTNILDQKAVGITRFNIDLNELKSFTFGKKELVHIGIDFKSSDKNLFPQLKIGD